jgi:hypothetical protein
MLVAVGVDRGDESDELACAFAGDGVLLAERQRLNMSISLCRCHRCMAVRLGQGNKSDDSFRQGFEEIHEELMTASAERVAG